VSDTISGSSTNPDGDATYSLTGDTLSFTEIFNPSVGALLEALYETAPGFPFASSVSLTPDASGTGLDVVGTGVFAGIAADDIFPGISFNTTVTASLTFRDNGADDFELSFTETVCCFTAGTLIETRTGARPVELIGVGDTVWAYGREAPVQWVGSRRIRVAEVADPDMVLPIRIRRDAMAIGQPSRDLVVSPDHAIWIDGKLIPARLLLNGRTIVQEHCEEVEYFHLALDRHDLLLAEGLQVESYLDVAAALATGATVSLLHPLVIGQPPALAAYDTHGYAPLTIEASLVRPVWDALADRAGIMVPANDRTAARSLADDDLAPLAVRVNGQMLRMDVIGQDGPATIYGCTLPMGAQELVLVSEAASPWSMCPWLDDRRRLGVAVTAMRALCDGAATAIPLDSAACGDGWHALEAIAVPQRWTDGAATLRLPAGTTILEVAVVAVTVPRPAARAA